jgi:cytochrome c553
MSSASAPPVGTLMLSDVYRGLDNLARGTIKQLRIVQVFPKTTNLANAPRVGVAGEENARAILGTVPVWEDGSAYFELPAGKPVLFQALDKDGFAYQTMRTVTYVQPGEKLSCIGCHESRMSTPPPRPALAAAHPPARIEPGPLGGAPFSYNRFVQPILDRRCVSCHGGEKPAKGLNLTRNQSYTPLSAFVPRYPARNQIQVTEPGGKLGALGSVLLQKLRAAHEKIGLTDEEMRTLAAWIDLNAVFFGSFDPADNAKELRGEAIAMPAIQ